MYNKYDTFDEVYKWLYNNVSVNMKLHSKTDFNKQEKIMYEAFAIGFLELIKERDKVLIKKLSTIKEGVRKDIEELANKWLDKTKSRVIFINDLGKPIEQRTTIEVNYPEKVNPINSFIEDAHTLAVLKTIDFTSISTFTKSIPHYDLTIKEILADNQGTWSVSPPRGVCITHHPTGISVTCTSNRSVFGNKDDGLETLKEVLHDTYYMLSKKVEVERNKKKEEA